nr:MAG TPA: hypothetical protein [Bacteriophage sp.]
MQGGICLDPQHKFVLFIPITRRHYCTVCKTTSPENLSPRIYRSSFDLIA